MLTNKVIDFLIGLTDWIGCDLVYHYFYFKMSILKVSPGTPVALL